MRPYSQQLGETADRLDEHHEFGLPKDDRPICFLDVDGVLNTVRPNKDTGDQQRFEGFPICMHKGLKRMLERLEAEFEIVWLTTWEEKANEHFCTHLGLGPWPVCKWRHRMSSNYKLPALWEWVEAKGAYDRGFVFIDDDAQWEWQKFGEKLQGELPNTPFRLYAPHVLTGLTDEVVNLACNFAWTLRNYGSVRAFPGVWTEPEWRKRLEGQDAA